MPPEFTVIAGRDVPVLPGPLTRVYFSGGARSDDLVGYYHFWTMKNAGNPVFPGRCYHDKDPGWRFRETEHRPVEHDVWMAAQTATLIRPSSPPEVEFWLNGHPDDARCAQHGECNGQTIRVGRDPVDGHFTVKPMP